MKVNFPEVPKGGERAVMGPKIRNSNRVFVDSPHKIYAGNLSWRITSEGLRDAFSDQPGVLGAKVIYERDSGRSRGFGFLSFASADDAESALKAMNEVVSKTDWKNRAFEFELLIFLTCMSLCVFSNLFSVSIHD